MPKHVTANNPKNHAVSRIILRIISVACWITAVFFSTAIFAGLIYMLIVAAAFGGIGWFSWHRANEYSKSDSNHTQRPKQKHRNKNHKLGDITIPTPSGIIFAESGKSMLSSEFIKAARDADLMVMDTETTGLTKSDRITDIGIVMVRNDQITAVFSQLINPGIPLSPFITDLTNITDDMLASAPGIEDVLPPLLDEISVLPVLGHNINFDIRMLNCEAERLGIAGLEPAEILDTLELDKEKFPGVVDHRLQDILLRLGIPEPEQHRALSDALQTLQCYLILRDMPVTVQSIQPNRMAFKQGKSSFDSERLHNALRSQYRETHSTVPVNRRPMGTKIEDYGGENVSGCYRHQEILSRYGRGTYFWVTVRKGYITSGVNKGYPTIYIDLDGEQIGFLSPQLMSRHYLHIPDGPAVALAHTRDTSDTTQKLRVRIELPKPHNRIDLTPYVRKT